MHVSHITSYPPKNQPQTQSTQAPEQTTQSTQTIPTIPTTTTPTTKMKAFTALVLTIATLAAAAPSSSGQANAVSLDTRQNVPGCDYSCLCQISGPGEPEVDPDTAKCCSGGSIENNDSVCPHFPFV
jgi:hypothetical protein